MGDKATGFASPAQGYEEEGIDLNRLLIRNPPATYFFRLESDDMAAMGFPPGSLLIVDRSKTPCLNEYVLIRHEGQFLCRQYREENTRTAIFTNGIENFSPVPGETEIFGIVTASINVFEAAKK